MSMEGGDLAATYSLVYSFLTERAHFKAAEAVRKAAKDVIILKGGHGQDGPTLHTIVKQWKKFATGKGNPIESTRSESSGSNADPDSSEDTESSSEESSGSDIGSETGSQSLQELGTDLKSKSIKETAVSAACTLRAGDSSDSDSATSGPLSDEGSDPESESGEDVPTPKTAVMRVNGTTASSALESRSPSGLSQTLPSISPSDDSSSDFESRHSSSSDDSSSSSSPDFDFGPASDTGKEPMEGGGKLRKVIVANTACVPAVGPPQKSNGPSAVTKRRRTDEIGNSVVTSIVQQPKASNPHHKGNNKGQPRKTNTPFSRIKVDEVKFADQRLKDNTFESRKAAANDYGAKANADFITTRGASFRKEKNKKKRGSYRGGEITMESHSIKFAN